MGLRSVKRCNDLDDANKFFSLEHPWRSWFWYMKQTVALAAKPGVRMAVFSNCCFGGRRQKWTAVLTNCPALFEALHQPECPHGFSHDYQPYYDEYGTIHFPTKEAEYPWGLCQAYAQAMKQAFQAQGKWPSPEPFQIARIERELTKYSRFGDADLKRKVAERIAQLEKELVTGKESEALSRLLAMGHYRGTDIRMTVEHNAVRELVPYPAYRWLWRDTLSYRWKQDSHINELETQALIAHIRRLLKDPGVLQMRLMVIVDSQVLYFAIGKGRSPSKRLNRLLKRLSALELAADIYVLPIWTLSAWNFADNPSRRA